MGTPILIGRDEIIREKMQSMGLEFSIKWKFIVLEINLNDRYADHIYERLQRKGFKRRLSRVTDKEKKCLCGMVSLNEADAMVCGLTRSYAASLESIEYVLIQFLIKLYLE